MTRVTRSSARASTKAKSEASKGKAKTVAAKKAKVTKKKVEKKRKAAADKYGTVEVIDQTDHDVDDVIR